MKSKAQSNARLWVLLARDARVAAILRRGPSRQVQLIKWDFRDDTFEHGQWIKGRIYDFGEYPGAVLDENAGIYIQGSVYLMSNTAMVLEKLDDYEGYGPDQKQPNLFIRQLVEVETDGQRIDCWVYLYNR